MKKKVPNIGQKCLLALDPEKRPPKKPKKRVKKMTKKSEKK